MRARCLTTYLAAAVLIGFAPALACDKKAETGSSATSPEPPPSASSGNTRVVGAGMRIVVGEHGFTPSSLTLAKGGPGVTVPITFVRTTDETCAKEVVFPEVGIKKDLPLKVPVTIDVPTDSARTLTFQCGMAMYKGALLVK